MVFNCYVFINLTDHEVHTEIEIFLPMLTTIFTPTFETPSGTEPIMMTYWGVTTTAAIAILRQFLEICPHSRFHSELTVNVLLIFCFRVLKRD